MKKRHIILFGLWKVKMTLLGIQKGRAVMLWSDDKQKYTKGYITSFNGVSVTNQKLGCDIGIDCLEPIEGDDIDYYTCGFYSYKDFKLGKVILI